MSRNLQCAQKQADRWHGWTGKGTVTVVSAEQPPHGLEPDGELPLDRSDLLE